MHNGVVIAGTCESVNVMEFRWNIHYDNWQFKYFILFCSFFLNLWKF